MKKIGYSIKKEGWKNMKKNLLIVNFIFIFFTLTACGAEMHSIQMGRISNEGNIRLEKSYKNEESYQKIHELLSDATNFHFSENEVDHFQRQYIQLLNEQQNILVVNYYLWDDVANERYICRPYYESDLLFYKIEGHKYRVLKKELELVKKSEEPIRKKDDKKNNRPVEESWTYDD